MKVDMIVRLSIGSGMYTIEELMTFTEMYQLMCIFEHLCYGKNAHLGYQYIQIRTPIAALVMIMQASWYFGSKNT